MEHENSVYTNYNWCARYNDQTIGTGNGGLRNKRTRVDHPYYCIGQNTEKGPGDMRTLAVMRNYQLTLVGETLKRVK